MDITPRESILFIGAKTYILSKQALVAGIRFATDSQPLSISELP